MASLKLRTNKEGREYYSISVCVGRDPDGKQKFAYKHFEIAPTWGKDYARKQAEAVARDFERDIREGRISVSSEKLGPYIDEVLRLKRENRECKLSTLSRYTDYRNAIVREMGDMKIREITPARLANFFIDLREGKITGHPLSAKTVHEYHSFLVMIFNSAEQDEIIVKNPAKAKKAKPPKATAKEVQALEPEQLEKLFAVLEQGPILWRAALVLLAYTGMRRGELMGLKWSNIDLEQGTIRICANLLRDHITGELYIDTPKTKKSIREIGIPSEAITLLRQLKISQTEQRLKSYGYFVDKGWVFASPSGDPMHPESITNYCAKLSKRIGFHVTPHMFRHTQATLLIANSVPISAVSARLGHAQISTTLNRYTHTFKKTDEGCVAVLSNVLSITN